MAIGIGGRPDAGLMKPLARGLLDVDSLIRRLDLAQPDSFAGDLVDIAREIESASLVPVCWACPRYRREACTFDPHRRRCCISILARRNNGNEYLLANRTNPSPSARRPTNECCDIGQGKWPRHCWRTGAVIALAAGAVAQEAVSAKSSWTRRLHRLSRLVDKALGRQPAAGPLRLLGAADSLLRGGLREP
jgi:hypothetical protein